MSEEETIETTNGHFIHLLLEVYCSFGWHENEDKKVPDFCKRGVKKPGYHCLENNCHFKAFTYR